MKAQARLKRNGECGRWCWVVKHDDGGLYLGTIYSTMKDAAELNSDDVAYLEKHSNLLDVEFIH